MTPLPERLVPVAASVRARLERGLDPRLHYHGAHHTFLDVLPAADRLCRGEGIPACDRELVLAAALFHDTGFLERYDGNEPVGARIAAHDLPDAGFSAREIERVLDLILATELRAVEGVLLQVPGADALKRILCDADLDNLGREDFFRVSAALRREIDEHGRRFDDLEWHSRQILFLSQHRWFTETQIRDRQSGKDANLASLREILGRLASGGG